MTLKENHTKIREKWMVMMIKMMKVM